MNKNQLATLKKEYKEQRYFSGKTEGYSFDFLSDEWVVGYKETLYLDWMNELDMETFIDLRLVIAHAIKHSVFSSIRGYASTLKIIINHLNVYAFKAWWLTLDDHKKRIRATLSFFSRRSEGYQSTVLGPLYEFVKDEILGNKNKITGILDDKTGAYSDVEHNNLLEALRIETLQALEGKMLQRKSFIRLRNVIACQLMVAIVRRPTQLVQIKWCDLLRVGQEFKSHKESDRDWQPVTQHLFSDVEQFHLRTFKGKDGQFRGNAESRSHRLSPDLSELLLRYYQAYEIYLCHSLYQHNITLTDEEVKELMRRFPLLPDLSLFSSEFHSKSELLSTVSDTSKAHHQTPDSLGKSIAYLFNSKLNVKSDRSPSKPLKLSNNRWRHTQLTLAMWIGLSPAQIAAITGVTIEAIMPYLDLKAQERVKIDQAYAGNSIIQRFDNTSIKELQKHSDFSIKSPFEEEIGHKLNPANCSSCQSKGGAPMACYPCDNFRPLETAKHQQYLDKAEQKLAINSQSGHPATVKRLQTVIVYIKATIAVCEERNTLKLGCDK
ncbi:hypothetical protein [Colwellia sp. Bg11-28]|uniref:hypothetical protein n=1 Tax=Colwellia sp. Bg11-28 TaxID=2058305 RepID=UPI000C33A07A|nr:hypothetical protein [Colwellia sp. Bg11-28]PKH87898.1 hypothetical protein CXF79_14865 [Colwellia sp. Bg11-28]